MYVQLNLVLFPAGGPFLLSLFVTRYIPRDAFISGALRELGVAL
jgi:hypothetical protein